MKTFTILLCAACAIPILSPAGEPEVLTTDESTLFAPLPFHLRLRGGLSHYDINDVEVQTGATWGVDTAVPLTETFGAYGAYKLNHFDGEYQTFISGGGYRQSTEDGSSLFDRIGAALLYDYFSDSRGDDFEVAQLRYQAGYLFAPGWAAGLRGSFSVEDEVNPVFYRPDADGDVTQLFELRDSAGLFLTGYLGSTMVDLGVNWRDRITADTVEFGALVRQPLRENLFAYIDTSYASHGSWMGLLGIEFRFGGPVAAPTPKASLDSRRSPWDDPTIATIFNSGEAKTFFGMAQGFSGNPPAAPEPPAPTPPPAPAPPNLDDL